MTAPEILPFLEELNAVHERYQLLLRFLIKEIEGLNKQILDPGVVRCSVCGDRVFMPDGYGYAYGKFYCYIQKPCRFL